MAKSLRFWLKICGIINDNPNSKAKPTLTRFGLKTFGPNGLDPYLEKKKQFGIYITTLFQIKKTCPHGVGFLTSMENRVLIDNNL